MKNDYGPLNRNMIFSLAAIIVTAYLISFFFNHPTYMIDCAFAYIVIVVLFFLEKNYPLKSWLIILAFLPFIIELTGLAFGFFSFSLFGVGFDKMLHFTNSFLITILLYFWISTDYKKHTGIKILIAMFIVIGFGSLGEIFEFLGQRYFHIYGPGMFSQGDLLPSTLKNDLINYDTWWDMIFNLIGASIAGIILLFKRK